MEHEQDRGERSNDGSVAAASAREDVVMNDVGALEHMGLQEDISNTHTSRESDDGLELPDLPDPSMPGLSFDQDLNDLLLGPDSSVWHWFNAEPQPEQAAASPMNEHIGDAASSVRSNEQTPSLLMSPHTSLESNSDFGINNGKLPNVTQGPTPDLRVITNASENREIVVDGSQGGSSIETVLTSKPYSCRICGKCFSQPGIQRKHEKNVHGPKHQRRHPCEQCGQRFNWPKDVRRHVRRMHEKDPPNEIFIRHPVFSDNQTSESGSQVMLDDQVRQWSTLEPEMTNEAISDYSQYSTTILTDSSPHKSNEQQQDWLCENNPDHNTFTRTHFPGDGSAPHRGARV